jgi:hypothetical protein
MRSGDTSSLIEQIYSVHATAFWYGSELLARCMEDGDPMLVEALTIRHQGLGNKAAGSARVIRQAIGAIAGDGLETLWTMIDEQDPDDPLTLEHPSNRARPWAAANIIGEIGGSAAVYGIRDRFRNASGSHADLLVRILAHLALRYVEIVGAEAPCVSHEQLSTGRTWEEELLPGQDDERRERVLSDRRLDAQRFGLIRPDVLEDLRAWVAGQDPSRINRHLLTEFGIPNADRSLDAFLSGSRSRAQEAFIDRVTFFRETLPRYTTLDHQRLLGVLKFMQTDAFWRDLVIAKRRTWTDADRTPAFWIERDWTVHGIRCVVELAAPGAAYPYTARFGLNRSHPLHGQDRTLVTQRFAPSGPTPAVGPQLVPSVVGYIPGEQEWWLEFETGAFYEDMAWAVEQAEEVAEYLSVLDQGG